MERSRDKIKSSDDPHFLTMTAVDWLPIFANPDVAERVLVSSRYLQEELPDTIIDSILL